MNSLSLADSESWTPNPGTVRLSQWFRWSSDRCDVYIAEASSNANISSSSRMPVHLKEIACNFIDFLESEFEKVYGPLGHISYRTLFQACPLQAIGQDPFTHNSCKFKLLGDDGDMYRTLQDVMNLEQKAANILLTNANAVTKGCPGCRFLFDTILDSDYKITLLCPKDLIAQEFYQEHKKHAYAYTVVDGKFKIYTFPDGPSKHGVDFSDDDDDDDDDES